MGSGVEHWVSSRDGTKLFYRRWPVDGARGTVAIIPGYADHSGRFGHVAVMLNELGLDVFGIDLRGHGRSEGARGYVSRFERYHEDVDALLGRIEAESAGGKRFVFGHSMGGLVAIHYGIERGPAWDGVVISSPFLGVYKPVPAVKRFLGRVMSVVHPKFSLPNGLDPADLSHDAQVGRDYVDDPLVFDISTARWYTEAMSAIASSRTNAGKFGFPCLFVQAGGDRIADPTQVKPLFDGVGSADKTYIEYPGFYHELINEIEKDKVLADVKSWFEARL